MPTAPEQSGIVLQEFHCPLPRGSAAVCCRRSTAQCPKVVRQCAARVPLSTAPGSVAMCCRRSTTHFPHAVRRWIARAPVLIGTEAVWQCAAKVRPPTVPRQCGSVQQEFHRPLPQGGAAVCSRRPTAALPRGNLAACSRLPSAHCPKAVWQCAARVPLTTAPEQVRQEFHYSRSSTTHCPKAVWQCVGGDPLPISPMQCGGGLHELLCSLAPRQCGSVQRKFDRPLSPGSVAVCSKSFAARCPKAVRQCVAGDPLPTAPEQVRQEFHYSRSSTTHCPKAVWQCAAAVPLPTTPEQ